MEMVRVTAGPGGKSRLEDFVVPFLEGGSRDAPWIPAVSAQFRSNPGPAEIAWHPAPRRQLVIILSGRLEIEAGDGSKRRFGPGDLLLADDLIGQGHISRYSGDFRRVYIAMPDWAPKAGATPLPPVPPIAQGAKLNGNTMVRSYTGKDDKTHVQKVDKLLEAEPVTKQPPVIPITGIQFRRSTAGQLSDFHHAPRRQLVPILSGGVHLGIGDGSKYDLTAGDVLLAEDLTGQGHNTQGHDDWRFAFLALAEGALAGHKW